MGPIILFFSGIIFTLLADNTINLKISFGISFLIWFLLFFIILEIIFTLIHFLYRKRLYSTPPKLKFDNLHIEPHPYIPYIFKPNKEGPPVTIANYPLHYGKYKTCKLKTNNLRFFNGEYGDREIIIPKPKGIIRINCLGASTTQNYISYKDKNYSYPLELEKLIHKNISKNIEVNNCGQGGYNSADILVRFILQTIESQPDIIIIYHGHADIRSYLTQNFSSDYSHSRKNLSEEYNRLRFSSKIPKMPFSFLNFLFNYWFPYNTRQSLIDLIHKKDLDLNVDYKKGLEVFERNLQHIIDICNARNIKVVLSTFSHILHESVKNSELHKIYSKIMDLENDKIKLLAKKNSLLLVDNEKKISKDEKYFVDTIHFSHEGMILIAKNFYEELKKILKNEKII